MGLKVVKVIVVLILLMALPALAETKRDFSLGVVFGDPTGFTLKKGLEGNHSVQAHLAYSLDDFLQISTDYLFELEELFPKKDRFFRELHPYIGVGGAVFISTDNSKQHDSGLAFRIPFGAEWQPRPHPIGIFLELAPGVGLIPDTYGFFQFGLGFRYYF